MKRFDHGYALLIGVNDCEVEKWALPGVSKDIDELEKVLKDPERCAYPEENIKKVTGADATKQGILEKLKWLRRSIEKDDSADATAIIYYSGHGWRDNSSGKTLFYLIPYNVNEQHISSSALKADEFSGAVASLNPRRLLVLLDCCHAGGMEVKDIDFLPNGYDATAIPPVQLMGDEKSIWKPGEVEPNALAKGYGRAVLSSSTGMQKSYFCRDRDLSIFTYHLIEALTGHARPQEGAAEVLVSDVMSHVWRRVPLSAKSAWGKEQMPDYNVNGNFPIALLLGGEGKSLENKIEDALEIGMENLDLQEYEAAFENFRKARGLMPENEKVQFYYCLTFLSGKSLLSIERSDMNEIHTILNKIVIGKNRKGINLARIVLGIIRYDYYEEKGYPYRGIPSKEIFRQLGRYYPTIEEKQLIKHIAFSEAAKIMFNLV